MWRLFKYFVTGQSVKPISLFLISLSSSVIFSLFLDWSYENKKDQQKKNKLLSYETMPYAYLPSSFPIKSVFFLFFFFRFFISNFFFRFFISLKKTYATPFFFIQDRLCSSADVLERRSVVRIAGAVTSLMAFHRGRPSAGI